MNPTYMLTTAFANEATLDRTFSFCNATMAEFYPWLVLNQHYPLPNPVAAQEGFSKVIEKWSLIHRLRIHDCGKNLGLHEGYNWLMRDLPHNAIVICVDADSLPASYGWDRALARVFGDPSIVWASLSNELSVGEMYERGKTEYMLGALKVIMPQAPVVNSICAFRLSWLREVGMLQEPNAWYGGLECAMWKHVDQRTKKWIFLKHFWEHRSVDFADQTDLLYREYKCAHAHQGDAREFSEWLREKI